MGCTSNTKKFVSIIVPVHNEEETLNKSLTSIRNQNVDEIIVILDNCTDDSEKIVKTHSENDQRIKFFHLKEHKYKKNKYAETVNFGALKTKNDFICIVDADSYLTVDYVTSLLQFFTEKTVAISGRIIPLNKKLFFYEETIRGTGRIIKSNVWNDIGGFHDILTCDTFFDLELMKRGYEVKVVNNVIQYDLRNYTLKQLASRAIRRGKGRRQIGQSILFMLGHGLYVLLKSPFGIIELMANIAGYISTKKIVGVNYMRSYERKRIQKIIHKLILKSTE